MQSESAERYEATFMTLRNRFPIDLVLVHREGALAKKLLDEILTLGRNEKLLRVLVEPACATEAFVYQVHEEARAALASADPRALELAELATLAARRCFGPPAAAPKRMRLVIESLALAVQAELAFGSRSRGEHHLWEAVTLVHGYDADFLASVELYLALALASFAHHHRDDTFGALRMARRMARTIKDPELEAQIGLVEARMHELSGNVELATASTLAARRRCPDPIPESHWMTVLGIIHLRAASVNPEVVQ